jgi:OOP family OmpA-OmpF porin
MIRYFFVCLALIGTSLFSHAQTNEKKLALGLYTGVSDYYGELNAQFFNINGIYRGQIGGTIMYYLNPSLNVGIDLGFGDHGFHLPFGGYRATVWKGIVSVRYKLNNDIFLPQTAKFQPYISLGSGFANTFIDLEGLNVPGLDWTVNTGVGFNYKINANLSLNYNLNYAMTNHDKRDRVSLTTINDQFIIHSIGIVVPIAHLEDRDEDGVVDKRDRCPNTPFGIEVDMFGCPFDNDSDGIADYQDKCPEVAGPPSLNGCPDKDDDGIGDADDQCPDLAGVLSAHGCPDKDGDGIRDADDLCPDVTGSLEQLGCPDTDGDGIIDKEDKCPSLAGSKEFNGCPDTDADGVPDNLDKCPKVFGTADNNGCPEVKEEVKKVFAKALIGIQFETGNAVIKKSSYGVLDNVANVMKENLSYSLDINGHTDNQGNDDVNMTLSKERAASVENYLISKSISATRLASYGFGETLPKESNDTAIGRAANRRVEFVIRFEE